MSEGSVKVWRANWDVRAIERGLWNELAEALVANLRTSVCRCNHVLFKYNCVFIPLVFLVLIQSLSRVQLFVWQSNVSAFQYTV